MPATPTAVSSPTGTATPLGHQSHSLGPLSLNTPLHEESQYQKEGPQLLFLDPVVSSDPALTWSHQERSMGRTKPRAPREPPSHTPQRSTPPSPKGSSSTKRKRKANGNVEDPSSKRRGKTAQPRKAGMEGQVIVTFSPSSTADTRPSKSTRSPARVQTVLDPHSMNGDGIERDSTLGMS